MLYLGATKRMGFQNLFIQISPDTKFGGQILQN